VSAANDVLGEPVVTDEKPSLPAAITGTMSALISASTAASSSSRAAALVGPPRLRFATRMLSPPGSPLSYFRRRSIAASIAAMTRDVGEPPPAAGNTLIGKMLAPGALPTIGSSRDVATHVGLGNAPP
jgi:hypothetical protein